MAAPLPLTAFERLATRFGNTGYGSQPAPPPFTKEARNLSTKVELPDALQLFDNVHASAPNRVPTVSPTRSTRDVTTQRSEHQIDAPRIQTLLPDHAPQGPSFLASLQADTAPSTSAQPIRVPDQLGLARSCSVEIQLLTFRSCIGQDADPRQLRYAMSVGRMKGRWKARIFRLPFFGPTHPVLARLRQNWQLVAEFHWGISSTEIVRRLVMSVGGEPAALPEVDPNIDEWDNLNGGGTRFITGRPWNLRSNLERESGRSQSDRETHPEQHNRRAGPE